MRRCCKAVAMFVTVFLLPFCFADDANAPKQTRPPDYSKPHSHIPDFFFPYIPRGVPPPNFTNTDRMSRVIRDGKLQLSLNDAIALALENNLDLVIARYNLSIADTDVLRTKAGAAARGVPTGVVQNTPGGTGSGIGSTSGGGSGSASATAGASSGGGAGGTSVGSGGAATGVAGQVSSTTGVGSSLDSYDPSFSSNIGINDNHTPLSNAVTSGTNALYGHSGFVNMSYGQAWATGTSMNFGIQNQRSYSNSIRSLLNPNYTSNWAVTVRQHLLTGFGLGPNLRFIRIARNNREIADVAFRQQVISTISQIQNIYWDLVSAFEAVKVQERSVALAEKTVSDNQAQVDVGTMAPIEIVRAKSDLAARRQDLIIAQSTLQLQQLLMKNAIARNVTNDLLDHAEVVPTDIMQVPAEEPVIPTQDLIADALAHRPELAQARIDLTNREITKSSARNALLPTVDIFGTYGGSGLAGSTNALCPPGSGFGCGGGGGGGTGGGTGTAPIPFLGTYGDAFDTAFSRDFPSYAVGLNVTIPIRNRAAQADQTRSELELRQAQARLQQLENQVRIEVRNAQFSAQQDRARVEAAQAGRDLAQQTLEAEQQKYQVGASTNFLVLQSQRDLVQAESNLVSAMTAYEKSRVELDRVVGLTLTRNGIVMDDAERGQVSHEPAAPGVQPRQDKP
ncbi:MAG: TolC family protein [Terriglobales bacterium]|jgi:outer membrane protein